MRYQQLFNHKQSQSELAYIPFVILGDPTYQLSLKIIERLVESGADALELGFAFSDPVADGPVIQAASLRPLANHFSIKDGFKLIKQVRDKYPQLPLGLLTYANLVFAQGIDGFYQQASAAGLDSVLIADCPVQEGALFSKSASEHGIDTVYIAPPDADQQTLKLIAENSSGYTYVLSRKGITGTEVAASQANLDFIAQLKALGSPPLVQGFGISEPEHVYQAAQAGVDAIITGSAIVKLINQHYNEPQVMLAKIADYANLMASAARQALKAHDRNNQDKGSIDVDSRDNKRGTAQAGAAS
ncbi:tryptophan synthase subunit alpha [Kangiella sp. TOML190]|uniref:tryptophan synthase subunit alpha n=1 Tax=Kangiella sp. TOML190 TaxID=2931351 RepID=UPI00203D5379|nr:tryptophan synthase subunit alpha [Kangiella sp. TOML190]